MSKNQTVGLKDRIERKRELEKEIFSIKAGLSSPKMMGLSSKGRACGDARSRLESFIYQHGNGAESGVPVVMRAELNALKDNVSRLSQEDSGLKEEKQQLETALELLQAEQTALDCTADINEITAQQDKIDTAKNEVLALAKIIEGQQAIINDNQCTPPEELYLKRQDLLAARAIGKDVANELQAIDKEIADEEKRIDGAGKLINDAKHAVEGLTRKFNEAKRQVELLEKDKTEMVIFFIKTEAAKVEQEYQDVAKGLADSYGRLCALDALLCQLTGNSGLSFISGAARHFSIPAFGPSSGGNGWLFDASSYDRPAMLTKEKTRLSAIGVYC